VEDIVHPLHLFYWPLLGPYFHINPIPERAAPEDQ
jgi:hypothetical protein